MIQPSGAARVMVAIKPVDFRGKWKGLLHWCAST